MTSPQSHVEEGKKLTADALVDLWEITLVGTASPVTLYLTNGPSVTWQTNDYEGDKALKMSTYSRDSDGKVSRPTLMLQNPFGLYNDAAHKGYFDGAGVIRRRVLRQHIVSNTNISQTEFWYIGKVKELISNQFINFELRAPSDGPEQQIPARKFIPPDFPFVKF